MRKLTFILLIVLLSWFTFDMFGFRSGDFVLVEAAWNSIDGIWWLIFVFLLLFFYFKEKVGKYLLTVFLLMWIFIQFISHWYYTLFGVTDEKLASYNEYFSETYHMIPASNTILIPDFYHIILHSLILVSFVSIIIYLIKRSYK